MGDHKFINILNQSNQDLINDEEKIFQNIRRAINDEHWILAIEFLKDFSDEKDFKKAINFIFEKLNQIAMNILRRSNNLRA